MVLVRPYNSFTWKVNMANTLLLAVQDPARSSIFLLRESRPPVRFKAAVALSFAAGLAVTNLLHSAEIDAASAAGTADARS